MITLIGLSCIGAFLAYHGIKIIKSAPTDTDVIKITTKPDLPVTIASEPTVKPEKTKNS